MKRETFGVAAVVAAIAISGSGCGKGSGKSEAEENLERLAAAAKAKFDKVGGFATGRVGPTPPVACCDQPDKQCADDATVWQLPGWQELGFSIKGPHKFAYSYEGSPTQFTATATGDLNCDGKGVTFTVKGKAEAGVVTYEWNKPATLE